MKVAKIRELTKNRKVACRSGLDNPSLIPHHRDRYPGSRNLYIKKERVNTLSFLQTDLPQEISNLLIVTLILALVCLRNGIKELINLVQESLEKLI